MTDAQWQFLESEFLTLSISGALQRSSTYATEDEKERERVRDELRLVLRDLASRYSDAEVSLDDHTRNIQELIDRLGENCSQFLDGDKLRVGIGQKALNLFLKYLWCAGRIKRPPHCPFDDSIINGREKLDLPRDSERRWTQASNIDQYIQWVSAADQKAQRKGLSIAEWELDLWNRTQAGNYSGVPIPPPPSQP